MGVLRVDARGFEPSLQIAGEQIVAAFTALAVPTLDEHGGSALPKDLLCLCGDLRVRLRHRLAGDPCGLVQIRRHQRGEREQAGDQKFDRLVCDERIATCRHHDRIEHHMRGLPFQQSRGHRIDRGGLRQHADFHRCHIEIGEQRLDLCSDKVRRHIVNGGHAKRVLRRQRGDYARGINTVCGH